MVTTLTHTDITSSGLTDASGPRISAPTASPWRDRVVAPSLVATTTGFASTTTSGSVGTAAATTTGAPCGHAAAARATATHASTSWLGGASRMSGSTADASKRNTTGRLGGMT